MYFILVLLLLLVLVLGLVGGLFLDCCYDVYFGFVLIFKFDLLFLFNC
jgi:hypothetical protein